MISIKKRCILPSVCSIENISFHCCKDASFEKIYFSVVAEVHTSRKCIFSVVAEVHTSRKYIFLLSQGCIHQENVFFPLPQRCIHRDNIFFRCRRGAYIKKIYFSVVAEVHTSRKYIFGSKISFATGADGTFSWHHSLLKRYFFAPKTK